MRLNTSIEYMVNMPINELLNLVQDVVEMDEEARRNRHS